MNYKSHYERLIERAYNRTLPDEVYTENHHIFPQAQYPEFKDAHWNQVDLLPEEHLVAHLLLTKIEPDNNSYLHAAFMMSNFKRINNKEYGWLRRKFSNRIVSHKTRKKLSDALSGKIKSDEHRKNLSEANKGLQFSAETRAKLSKAAKGRKHTQETKDKLKVIQTEIHLQKTGKRFSVVDPDGNETIHFGLKALREFIESKDLCFRSIEMMLYNGHVFKRGKHAQWTVDYVN